MSLLLSVFSAGLLIGPGPVCDTLSIPAASIVVRKEAPPSARVSGAALASCASAADAVRTFTGLQLKDYGGVGGLKTVNVRSLGSQHVGVYLDGIAIDQAQNMQVDLGRLSTWSLLEISLYNGQKNNPLQTAKEYGSASALHFTTAAPWENRLRARVSGGSFGSFSGGLLLERCLGDRWSLRTSAEYTRTDGNYRYRLSGYRTGEGGEWKRFDSTLVRENGDLHSLKADAELFYSAAFREGRIGVRYYGSERGFPGPVVRRADPFPLSADRQKDHALSLQGQWNFATFGRIYELTLRGKLSDDYTRYETHPERNPMALPYDNYYRQLAGYLSVSQRLRLGEFDLSLATDVQYNRLDSDAGQFVRPTRLTTYTAAALTWSPDSFRASASLLHTFAADRFDREAGGFTRENTSRSVFSPFVRLEYLFRKHFSLSAFAKRSYRMPTFNDLYYTFMGNANLRPEDARQVSAAVSYHSGDRARPDRPWQVQARAEAYHNRVLDKIVALPTASQFRWTMLNFGKVDIDGAELEAGVHYDSAIPRLVRRLRQKNVIPRLVRGISWGVTARYTYQRAVNRLEPYAGNQIPYIPLHSGTVSAVVAWKGWRADWTSSFTGLRYSTAVSTPDYEVAPFSLSDLRLEKRLPVRGGEYTFRLSLNNVFGSRYEVVQHYPMPGRHLIAGVELSF